MKTFLSILISGIIALNLNSSNEKAPISIELFYHLLSAKTEPTPVIESQPIGVEVKKSITIKVLPKVKVNESPIVKETVDVVLEKSMVGGKLLPIDSLKFKGFKIATMDNTPRSVDSLQPSEYIYVMISDMEGFTATPVLCGNNHAVGFGRAVYGKTLSFYRNNPMTKAEAFKNLKEDVDYFSQNIKQHYKGRMLTQGQFDAFISLSYSTGFYGYIKKYFAKKSLTDVELTRADFTNTVCELYKKTLPGLVTRRIREYYMYQGIYIYLNKHKVF